MTLEASSPIKVRRSKETGNSRVDDANEFGSKEVGENMSNVNPFAKRFLTSKARVTFIRLKIAFTEEPIFHHFDLKRDIWIETNTSGFTICEILSQLTLGYVSYKNTNLSTSEIGQ